MTDKPVWKKVGTIRKSEDKDGKPGKLYVKIEEGVTLEKGAVLQVQNPRERVKELAAAGKISEEKAEDLLSKIPDFIRYELILPPKR